MKVFLQATDLTRRVGDKTLFHGISIGIGEGQRVGLIAQNGTGKTTLLNILAGVDEPDEGEVVLRSGIRVGYLSQTPEFPSEMSVMDACFWHACQDRNDTEEALDLEVRSKQILGKLKIGDTTRKMGVLSGGQVKRVALANVLLQNPDLLVLDEPTNHLDLEMIEWLEGYLGRQCITLLMVTHDRYFLDRVCNVILEMDDQTLYTYRGNYAYYLEKRQERIDNARAEIARANNLYRTELEWMRSTPQARSHKARYREEAFYELEKKAKRHIEEDKLRLQVNSTYIGSKIFEAEYVSKSFPAGEGREELVILKDFYYNFSRYEKMGIVGNNGTGKSTFLKLLLGLVQPDSGRFVIGETVKFGYFSQEPMQVDESMKVIDAVRRVAEYVDLGGGKHLTAMQFLQHFMFTPLQQQNYIYKLSGGERRRLQLCTMLMQNPNFLILDEPTNDMDIVTLQILEQYLQDFRGCVIIVSHDRYFMDKVVDHLLVFQGEGRVKDFPGNYTQFRESEKLLEKTENGKVKTENSSPSANGKPRLTEKKRKLTFKERQEFEQLEKDIEALEQEKVHIETTLSSGAVSVEDITAMSKRLSLLNDELDEKSMRWLELSEFI